MASIGIRGSLADLSLCLRYAYEAGGRGLSEKAMREPGSGMDGVRNGDCAGKAS